MCLSASPHVSLAGHSPSRPLDRGWPVSGQLQRRVGRHDLRGLVEVIAEILDALIGEVPVEVSPGKLFLHVAARFERQYSFHDVTIRHVLVCQLRVLGHVDILLGHHHPLLKKEFINGNPVLLGHQHHNGCFIQGWSWKSENLPVFKVG